MAIVTAMCPKCGSTSVDSLASNEVLFRYQCKNVDCLHQWNVPRERPTPALPEGETGGADEEKSMAKREQCEDCGEQVSTHPPARARHMKKCGKRRPAAATESGTTSRRRTTRKPRKVSGILPAANPIQGALDNLYGRRDKLMMENPELQKILEAISALEEVRPT